MGNVGLEVRRDPTSKDSDLKVEMLIEHEASKGDRDLQLNIWWVGVGWGRNASEKLSDKQNEKKSWTMENSTYFLAYHWGNQVVEPKEYCLLPFRF